MSGDQPVLASLPLLEDLGDIAGKRVLVRLDLNVPLADGAGGKRVVSDDFRIRAALPTLQYLAAGGATVTVATHLGRPKGSVDPRFAVEPVAERLAEMGAAVRVLENLRFSPGEEANSPELVASLVEGQDLFVNDAFGVMHRAHASVVGPPQFLLSAAGRLVEREVTAVAPFLSDPPRPFVVVIGGAKVKDKLGLLASLVQRADAVLVGGGMAFTFLHALGHPTGDSILDRAHLDECRHIAATSSSLLLPVDIIGAAPGVEITPVAASGTDAVVEGSKEEVRVYGQGLPDGWKGLDIGPATSELFREAIAGAGSVFWNGPVGAFEDPRFARGTFEVASAMAATDALTFVGGGDSAAAIDRFGLEGSVDHISTGGGASLELLEYGDLPGLAALRENALRHRRGELAPPGRAQT
ncbi:MAG: phosphoglycerate kinase [Acidimicrobiales bacterium]